MSTYNLLVCALFINSGVTIQIKSVTHNLRRTFGEWSTEKVPHSELN